MKSVLLPALAISFIFLVSCKGRKQPGTISDSKADSAEVAPYRPGRGEFMTSIQIHHAKLWFAGKAANWRLAAFEIHEIDEAIDDIKTYCADRPETKSLGIINQPLQQLEQAIDAKDTSSFYKQYKLFTATCNECHQATQHEFNIIKIPSRAPFDNQDFSAAGKAAAD